MSKNKTVTFDDSDDDRRVMDICLSAEQVQRIDANIRNKASRQEIGAKRKNGTNDAGQKLRRVIDDDEDQDETASEENASDDCNTSDEGNLGTNDRISNCGENTDDGNTTDEHNQGADDSNATNGENSDDDQISYDDCNGENFEADDEEENEELIDSSNHCTQLLGINEKKQQINKEVKSILQANKKADDSREDLLNIFKNEEIEIAEATGCTILYKLFLKHSKNELLLGMLEEKPQVGRRSAELNLEAFISLSQSLNIHVPKSGTRCNEQETDYSDYEQMYQQVLDKKVELGRMKNQFKRHWKNNYKKFLTKVFADPKEDNRCKVPRKVSKKPKKKPQRTSGPSSALVAELDNLAAVLHSRRQQEMTPSTAVTTQPVHPPPTTGVASLQATPAVVVHASETSTISTTTEASEIDILKTKYQKMETYCSKMEQKLLRRDASLTQAGEKIKELEKQIRRLSGSSSENEGSND